MEKRGQQIIINLYGIRACIIWREDVTIDNFFFLTTALQKLRDSGFILRIKNVYFFATTSINLTIRLPFLNHIFISVMWHKNHESLWKSENCKKTHDHSKNHCFCWGKNLMFPISPCHKLYVLKVISSKSMHYSENIYIIFQPILHYPYACLLLALCIAALLF